MAPWLPPPDGGALTSGRYCFLCLANTMGSLFGFVGVYWLET
jgi:hypothetical protein